MCSVSDHPLNADSDMFRDLTHWCMKVTLYAFRYTNCKKPENHCIDAFCYLHAIGSLKTTVLLTIAHVANAFVQTAKMMTKASRHFLLPQFFRQ